MDSVVASGWTRESSDDFFVKTGHSNIHEGEIYNFMEKEVWLACSRVDNFPMFEELVPLQKWPGKTVVSVGKMVGGRIFDVPGGEMKEIIYLLRFDDGTISTFFIEGSQVVSPSDSEEPDMDLMISAGMLLASVKESRRIEEELYDRLTEESRANKSERYQLQLSLLNAKPGEKRKIGRAIAVLEEQISLAEEQIDGEWFWQNKDFDFQSLTWLIPNLVDLFDWRSLDVPNRKVDDMLAPKGRLIKAVHKIFDASSVESSSSDAYALEFEGHRFSTPIGLCNERRIGLPLNGLLAQGFITQNQFDETIVRLKEARSVGKENRSVLAQIAELRRELEQPGLSLEETLRILQELHSLDPSIADQVTST